jgi:chromate reductase, NAD(P)H dehydrogenase (quinone)
MVKILAFSGGLREHSYNRRVLNVAIEGARAAGAEVTLIDLRDFPMPIFNPDECAEAFDENAARLQDILIEHDGLLIASPEYNGSVPGGIKNVFDWTSRPSAKYSKSVEVYKGKFAAIMTASPGSFGGIRSLAHMRGILTLMFVNVLPVEIAVTFANGKFEGDSAEMTDDKTKKILQDLGAALVDMIRRTKSSA